MLPSGNDAALVLAEAVSGSTENFVELMNSKLKEIGASNTHFVNPHGFHDNNHYSTCEDMAKIFRYCLQNDTFKEIISTKSYTLEPTNITNESRKLTNTNKLCNESYKKIYYEYMVGGKTGYTIEANGTFIGYAKKDDKNIIVGCFNGSQDINGYQGRYLDAVTLSNYAFDNFNKYEIANISDYSFYINDYQNMLKNNIHLSSNIEYLLNDLTYCINNYDIKIDYQKLNLLNKDYKDEINIYTSENITPIVVGTITIYSNIDGNIIKNNFDLVCDNISKINYFKFKFSYLISTILILLVFITFILYLKINFSSTKNTKKRYSKRKKTKKSNSNLNKRYLDKNIKKINDPLNVFNSARYR